MISSYTFRTPPSKYHDRTNQACNYGRQELLAILAVEPFKIAIQRLHDFPLQLPVFNFSSSLISTTKRRLWKLCRKGEKLKRRKICAANAGSDRTKFVAFASSAALDQSARDSDDFLRRLDIHIWRFFDGEQRGWRLYRAYTRSVSITT